MRFFPRPIFLLLPALLSFSALKGADYYWVGGSGNWSLPIYIMSGLFFLGAICWLFIDPRNKVFE